MPEDWAFALRAGIEPVLAGWLVAVIVTVAVYVATSSKDAAAALSVGSAVRTGTGLWALGLGAPYGDSSSADGALGLPLLGLTIVIVLVTRWSVGRSRLTGPAAGGWAVGGSLASAALLVAFASEGAARPWPAVLGAAVVTAAVVGWELLRHGRGGERIQAAWATRAPWVDPALRRARRTAIGIGALVLVVGAVAVVQGAGRVSRLHDALSGGGIIAGLGLVLLELGWLPSLLVWAMAWLVGPGFTVGAGTIFAPDQVIAGAVPALPILGLLPTSPAGTIGLYVPLTVTAAAMVAAWWSREDLRALRLGEAMAAAVAAAVLLALGAALLCLAASGSVGPGRLAEAGPKTVYVVLLVLLETGFGLAAVTAVVHPRVRRATSQGVEATARAADSAAGTARQRLEVGLDSARERRERAQEARAARAAARQEEADSAVLETGPPVGFAPGGCATATPLGPSARSARSAGSATTPGLAASPSAAASASSAPSAVSPSASSQPSDVTEALPTLQDGAQTPRRRRPSPFAGWREAGTADEDEATGSDPAEED